ncbi:Sjoegren syndrome/scleroderma autoantigen 1-like protein [Sarcoptes scabiei]|uniref:Sjoegren syndrome/scleroderma autoantigen 1-like protein n=1 Tax=Sarcoptes scabiei TaxID=52283 RepID=A0A132AEL0_SARSC|nr:Sjoegren syndrome/scleroderma autoantigen 1-like protein [Sarcoptes scabiei]
MISSNEMNEVTTKISAYLLQGYTLLDKYCEVCKTPLMRFKNEAEFCVFCDKIKAKRIIVFRQRKTDIKPPGLQHRCLKIKFRPNGCWSGDA